MQRDSESWKSDRLTLDMHSHNTISKTWVANKSQDRTQCGVNGSELSIRAQLRNDIEKYICDEIIHEP